MLRGSLVRGRQRYRKRRVGGEPTPRVPTRIPNTSASRAFWRIAYRRIRSLFVFIDWRVACRVVGS
jgi:hypothetical protein